VKPATTVAAKPAAAKAVAAKPAPAKSSVAKASATKPSAKSTAAKASALKPAPAKEVPSTAPTPAIAVAKPIAPEKPSVAPPRPAAALPSPVAEAPKPALAKSIVATSATAPAFSAELVAFVPGQVLPKAVHELATTSLNQARETYEKVRHSAETLSAGMGHSGEAAAKGMQDFSQALIDAIKTNTDATLGFFRSMAAVRSVSEAVELQARHARTQFETVSEQAKALAGIANRTVTQTSKPVREAFDSTMKTGR
jgi:phasin